MKMVALFVLLALQEKPPDPAAIADAEKLVQSLYKEDYAKKAPKDRASLGQKLLDQARQSKSAPASQYVLYRESQDFLAQGGDWAGGFDVIDEWARRFQVDAVDLKVKAVASAAKVVKTPEEALAIGTAHLKAADAAAARDRFDVADKEAQAALAAAKKAANVPAVNRATAKSKEIAELKVAFDKVKKSRDTLAATPDDPEANLVVGKYQCFSKGNWDEGLPLLAKGGDAALKELAAKDIAGPPDPATQLEVGDGWWDLGEKSPARGLLHARAAAWYDKAAPKLEGLSRRKAEQRSTEVAMAQLFKGAWIDVDPKLLVGAGNEKEPPPTGFTYKILNEMPAGSEYDALSIRIRATGKDPSNLRLEVDRSLTQLVYFDASNRVMYSAVKEGGSSRREASSPLDPAEEYIVTLVLQDGQMAVYLNGREKFRVPTEYKAVKHPGYYRLTGSYTCDQLKLRKKN